MATHWQHPILSCAESAEFEAKWFGGDEEKAARAMETAGMALGRRLLKDLGPRWDGKDKRCLLLLGKGHNAGDALVAATVLLDTLPDLWMEVCSILGTSGMSAAVKPWWERVSKHARVRQIRADALHSATGRRTYDVSIDGIFGMQFHAPLSETLRKLFEKINSLDILVRIAVDLPSGLSDCCNGPALKADFTYATGILKGPLILPENLSTIGRVRYLDIGFFDTPVVPSSSFHIANEELLRVGKRVRPVACDKRSFGHLLMVAGSRNMPGAMLMAVKAAVRSGVGLVTVVACESIVAPIAGLVPEAMWFPWSETPHGGLALEGIHELQQLRGKITAVLMGPGCGVEPETQALLDEVIEHFEVPFILDADALTLERMERLRKENRSFVLTPHEGEFRRVAALNPEARVDDVALRQFASTFNPSQGAVVLKGPLTRMSDGRQVVYFPMGNPMLARGGSGDILAGLISGKVAMSDKNRFCHAAACGIAVHGNAADQLFSSKEETHIQTTDILNFLNLY